MTQHAQVEWNQMRSASVCPKCKSPSPLFDYNEVDIGVGVQIFNESWECPIHGVFGFHFNEETLKTEPIFQYDD
jgi:hypothetical protein